MAREINFSVSALGELKATIELDAARKQAERKILLDGYIDDGKPAKLAGFIPGKFTAGAYIDSSLTNLPFIFQSQFSNPSGTNGLFIVSLHMVKKNYSLITGSIPAACEDGSLGFFLLFRKLSIKSLQILKMSHRFSAGCTRTG